jgi:DNA-binding transcriptional MerR regulator
MAVPAIPDKLYFQIGEVCRILELEPYVLRFWEREFPTLSPAKGANGRRMYRKKDVEMALAIRELLYSQGFTIPGARKLLGRGKERGQTLESLRDPLPEKREAAPSPSSPVQTHSPPMLSMIKAELQNILTILNRRC